MRIKLSELKRIILTEIQRSLHEGPGDEYTDEYMDNDKMNPVTSRMRGFGNATDNDVAVRHADNIDYVVNCAKNGYRITLVDASGSERQIWKGLGNRAGLHDFARELLMKQWKQGKNRFMRELASAMHGTTVRVYSFTNRTRESGNWRQIDAFVF